MSIQSISFWQQDQNYWQQAQAQSQAQSADDSLITVIQDAETNLGKGLASIANQTALNRVNSQITALVQQALGTSSSSSNSSASSSSSTSASSASSPTPATGTGTVPLTTSTTLSSLGILPGSTFSIDDGTNITKYTSTGNDTVADLINAINSGPAFVTASINSSGKLVITARDSKETVTVEGSGNEAAALGFGIGNNSFTPTTPSSTASGSSGSPNASSTSSTTSTSSASSSKTSSSSSKSTSVTSYAQEISSSAASILSASGVSGTLVDMLA